MPQKDDIVQDFFTILRVTFKTATIYKTGHPAFQKAADDLMAKINDLLTVINPISIGFTPNSLYIDNQFWEHEKTFVQLARLFHFRKIKTLEIQKGVTPDEVVRFASKITLPLPEFIKEGGARTILKKEQISHITVEELDYSELLKGEGEGIQDLWPYLLMEAIEQNDVQKLKMLAESFEKFIGKFKAEALILNQELYNNFAKLFQYLKETGEEKYRSCARELLKSILSGKQLDAEAKLDNLKTLISGLSEEDLATTLWEEIVCDEKFDSLSFGIFSKLVDEHRHLKISTSLRELFQTDNPLNRKPEVGQKIRGLLSGAGGQFVSEIYRQTLTKLLSEISFGNKIAFDTYHLMRNYRFMLLNIFEKETQTGSAAKTLGKILEEWDKIAESKDLEYLKCLRDILDQKEKELSKEPDFQKTKTSISKIIENLILEGESSSDLDDFIMKLKSSIFERNAYLEKIFSQKTVTPTLLRAYFGFFTQYMFEFEARLRQKSSNTLFLERIADSLKFIDTPISLVILKKLFSIGEVLVKFRVLRAMQNLTEYDEKFLMHILDIKESSLKAEALLLLMRNERTKSAALEKLLNIESPYGLRNKKLIGHIKIVGDKNIREAKGHLDSLSQRKNFWNKKVREAASRVLEKWNER